MTSLKVLVVDDDPDTAAGLAELLTTRGHQARIAHDGRGALRQVRNDDFQLVLLDIGLPDMDGYEVSARLKDDHRTQDIPVIFVTAQSSE